MDTNLYTDIKQDVKIDAYNYLMDLYIDTINKLIDTSYSMGILPLKIILGLNYIKKYIANNRIEILQNGTFYLLTNKETILNFDLNKLDELDMDSDDNMSVKSCVSRVKQQSKINNQTNLSNQTNLQNFSSDSDDMLNLIIDIKNKTKNLNNDDVQIIKKYFELIIIILEKIKNLFL